ncbi:NACHT and ankyrin domain protein [Apiospora marii]|uniref:NACHT and ankyrin domain protein n=1 Tax=Apiospora marii TaxID=335849 RepID=UPI00312FE3FA
MASRCYCDIATAVSRLDDPTAFSHDKLGVEQALGECLAHLGPKGVHHADDDGPLDRMIHKLWLDQPFGPIAASIKLCELDSLPNSFDVDKQLLPLFLAVAAEGASWEAVEPLLLAEDAVLASPLFRQALIVTAMCTSNFAVAKGLIDHIPLPAPPPPEQNMMTQDSVESWYRLRELDLCPLWAGLIAAGWVEASSRFITFAVLCPDGAAGVALCEALEARGVRIADGHRALRGAALAEMALGHCPTAEVLAYLMAACGHPPLPADALIRAVEFSPHGFWPVGPVGVLAYLLDRHPQAFDVHYRRPDRRRRHIYDPRDMAEREDRRGGRPPTEDLEITALHMAADRGHWDAVEFLLDRRADRDARDGLGRTALEIATVEGHARVVEVLKARDG